MRLSWLNARSSMDRTGPQRRAGVSPAQRALWRHGESKTLVGGRQEAYPTLSFVDRIFATQCGRFGRLIDRLRCHRSPPGQKNKKRRDATENKNHHRKQGYNSPVHPLGQVRVGLAETGGTGEQRPGGPDRAQQRRPCCPAKNSVVTAARCFPGTDPPPL